MAAVMASSSDTGAKNIAADAGLLSLSGLSPDIPFGGTVLGQLSQPPHVFGVGNRF